MNSIVKLIAAVIVGIVVITLGGCFALIGGVAHVVKDVSTGEALVDRDIYDVTQLRPGERDKIEKSCRAAFGPGKPVDNYVSDIRKHKAKAKPFCACVAEAANDTPAYDRHVLTSKLENNLVRMTKLRVGLTKAGLSSSSASNRHSEATRRIEEIMERCVVESEMQ